ncbi:MAG: DM13 domain-containing protein, partial [Cyanobacteria bacterium J06633_1]
GPDLEIILHKDPVVESSIAEADYISLAPIESFTGTQRYEVPADVNLDDYGSVSVWCEEFNVTFGYAEL